MRIRRNESDPTARSMFLAVRNADGDWVAPNGLALTDLLYDNGTGVMALAGGTLANRSKPHTFVAFTFTTTHATETVNKVAHGRVTGDGPVQLTTTTTLPAGYALATNYWVIKTSADTLQLANSLANALAGVPVPITSDGTGTHTLSAVAGTKRLMNGQFVYTFLQAETNVTSTWISITVEESALFSKLEQTADMFTRAMDDIAVSTGQTYGELARYNSGIVGGPVLNFETNTYEFKCPFTGVTRCTGVVSSAGRLTVTPGTLTP